MKTGAMITCNHFNPFDSFAIEKAFRMSGQIKNKRLTFSIIGGLERTKRKYDNSDYQARTYHTVEELIKILEYFEDIEKGITPEMNEMQKCILQDIENMLTAAK